jgi:Family of unknown function (DUF5336)
MLANNRELEAAEQDLGTCASVGSDHGSDAALRRCGANSTGEAMSYSSGGPGYPGAQQPGAYAPTTQLAKVDDGPSKLPLYLLAGVAVLGLGGYLLSFGPVWKSGESGSSVTVLGIIAVLFAALFAVIALLPKQGNYTPVVTATAVVGLLLTIWDLIKGADAAGWALIAIVVLSALQTVAAIAALLLDAEVISPPAPQPKFDPYQPYGGGFYGQPQFSGPPTGRHGPPTGPRGPQSFSQPQGFPHHGGYPGSASPGGFPTQVHQVGPPTPPTGFPTYTQPPSPPAGGEQQPAPPPRDAPTQQVSVPQQSPSPSAPPPS